MMGTMFYKGTGMFIWMMLLMAVPSWLNAQEVWFFTEGTDQTFYDQGIVDVANLGESLFEYTYPPGGPQWNDKVPCSTNAYNGSTSLKFNYTSSSSGNWKVKIFRNDWSSADISGLDTLAFFFYSEVGMPGPALPLVGLQAENTGGGETESGLYSLSLFNEDIPASQWIRVAIPLDVILEDGDNTALDFSKTKAVIFNQSESDNSARVFLADNVVAYKALTDIPAPVDFAATGYDSHAELTWKQPVSDLSYSISASFDGGATFQGRVVTTGSSYMDFLSTENRNKDVIYRIVTKSQEKESEPLEQTAQIRDFTDDELMDMVQRYAFRYFWEGAHQATGMALERSNGNGRTAASGATGMGLMGMIVAHEREYKPKEEVKDRILLILDFLETCDRHHGAWSHWYNADTKRTQPFSPNDDGGDIVETSFVAEALVALKNYFIMEDAKSGQIRDKSDQLWKGIDWDWYRRDGQNVIFWHWSPNVGWAMNMQVRGWNEALVTYIMAASSPTHGIPEEVYTNGWTRNGTIVNKRRFYERDIYLSPNWGGPLFWLHYTHLGIDARGLMDESVSYWDEYVNTAMIHYEYAKENPNNFDNYSEHCWGLTASDDPDGYTAHRPWDNDNGTVSPTAALASMPYTPAESMKALKYFYRERGDELFGPYGPYDAFNDSRDWVQEAYLGIDQGPIVVMIENHRTALLWDAVKKDTDVNAGLKKLGFWYDPVDVKNEAVPEAFSIYPNPGNGTVTFHCPGLTVGQAASASLFTMDGRLIKTALLHQEESQVNWSDVSKGLYLVSVLQGDSSWISKLIIQ
jgi:hypothetical protein